jgi:hypothetical protein
MTHEDNSVQTFCPSCDAVNTHNANFCNNCGESLQPIEHQQPIHFINEPEREYHNFIQNNSEYYTGKFYKMKADNSDVSWNWAACLLSPYWFFYRKMYIHGIVLFLLFVVSDTINRALYMFLSILSALLIGAYGNNFYKKYVEQHLGQSKDYDEDTKKKYYNSKGGTNILLVLGIIVCNIIIRWLIG